MTETEHAGTYSRYKRGCRCEPCTAANRTNNFEQRARRLTRAIPDHVNHGRSAYINWGCRCDVCTKGQKDYMNDYRKAGRWRA